MIVIVEAQDASRPLINYHDEAIIIEQEMSNRIEQLRRDIDVGLKEVNSRMSVEVLEGIDYRLRQTRKQIANIATKADVSEREFQQLQDISNGLYSMERAVRYALTTTNVTVDVKRNATTKSVKVVAPPPPLDAKFFVAAAITYTCFLYVCILKSHDITRPLNLID